MPYIGMFTDDAINKAIDKASENLAPGKTRVVAHWDTDGQAYISLVKRLGEHFSVESAFVLDTSEGFKLDKEHMKGQVEVIGEF